ncbi:MAG: hypothetical protein KatS3mg015_3014 [Fimbriimonadales bacterium]|nr:MAG: hypothetical protein KatS3mg015_3014 [Fimbriimonadales bacterium]
MASAAEIRAGRASVELTLTDRLTANLNAISRKLATWGVALQGIGASILAAFRPALSVFQEQEVIGGWALRLRTSVEQFSKLASLFRVWGVGVDELGASLESMTSKLDAKAVAEFGDVLQSLGVISFAHLPLEQRLEIVLGALQRIPNETQRARIAVELFGDRVGMSLVSMGMLSSDAKERLANLFATTSEQAQRATQIMQSWREITASISAVWYEVAAAIAPVVQTIAAWLQNVTASFVAWVRENQGAVIAIAALGAGLVTAGTALLAFAGIVKLVSVALGAFTTILAVLKAIVLAIATPIGLVVAGIAALGVVAVASGNNTIEKFREVRADIQGLATDWSNAFKAIVAAIKSGDIETAFNILVKTLELTWATLIQSLKRLWWSFVRDIFQFFVDNPWVLPLVGGGAGLFIAGPWGGLAGVGVGAVGQGVLALNAQEIDKFFEEKIQNVDRGRVDQLRWELEQMILQALRRQQQQQREQQGPPKGRVGAMEAVFVPKEEIANMLAIGEARGTFTAFAARQQFAFGTRTQKRQEDLLADILKEVRKVQQGVDNNMRVK